MKRFQSWTIMMDYHRGRGSWLAWMTGTDGWHGWLVWMTGIDDWHGWPAWMTGMDDWHGWLAWMTGMDWFKLFLQVVYRRTDGLTDRRTLVPLKSLSRLKSSCSNWNKLRKLKLFDVFVPFCRAIFGHFVTSCAAHTQLIFRNFCWGLGHS